MPPTGFEPTIPASKQSQPHASDRAATRIGEELIGTAEYEATEEVSHVVTT